jgi:ABC-type Fe2+-enterobactin transport system substrate-binding protein
MFGSILKTVVKTAVGLPAGIIADVATMGVSKMADDKFFFEKACDWIDED